MVLASKTKTPSIHHRKRNGQHHKATKAYHKTYWPYLPLVFIIGLGIAVNSFWAHADHGVLGYSTDMSVSELYADTNTQRSGYNLPDLGLSDALDSAAQAKANSMVSLDYWSHYTPTGQPPWVFITAAGYSFTSAGENLAYGFDTSQEVINAWMASPEHRANILNTDYRDVGFGIANSSNFIGKGPVTVIVAEYAQPASELGSDTNTSPALTSTAPTGTTPTTPTTISNSNSTPSTGAVDGASTITYIASHSTPVSRLQLLGNNITPISALTVTLLAVLCLFVFFIRHALIWNRVLRKGERFAIRYHMLDIVLVTVGVIGFLLTRNAGYIH